MSITIDETAVRATAARVTDDSLIVELDDGRTIVTPIVWYPRLVHGTPEERNNIELGAFGIHFPDLNEDLSIAGMLAGRRSGEGSKSLQRWLEYRARGEKEPILTLPMPPDLQAEMDRELDEEAGH
jgi:hypothetical protein